MRIFLVDNGSLRPESTRNLRRLAEEVRRRSGKEVVAASLLHSNRVDAAELGGQPAVVLERQIRGAMAAGERRFGILPFFLGPTGALTRYLPERLAFLREHVGAVEVERAPFLYRGQGEELACLLEDRVRETMREARLERPRVALVDHGSPLPEVAAVRNVLAASLRDRLGEQVETVAPASMERRDGVEYAFNEPLLEHLLREEGWNTSTVVVAMLFLSPGRHAGEDGDVAQICAAAQAEHPELRCYRTELLGTHAGIAGILVRRLQQTRVVL